MIDECKIKIKDNNEEKCKEFSDLVSHKIDFKANGVNRGHPSAWELDNIAKGHYIYGFFIVFCRSLVKNEKCWKCSLM